MPASSLHLKRYPTWLQAAVLPWLPVTALLFFFTVPRSEVLVCGHTCTLQIEHGVQTKLLPVRDIRTGRDGDTKREILVVETIQGGVERFVLDDPKPALEAWQRRASLENETRFELLGTTWMTIFLGLLSVEAGLILAFALSQRRTTIDVDAKAGTARVDKTSLLKPRVVMDLKLSEIASFALEDSNGGLLVVAKKSADSERVVLLDAMRPQAERAFDHLTLAHDAWQAAHPPEG